MRVKKIRDLIAEIRVEAQAHQAAYLADLIEDYLGGFGLEAERTVECAYCGDTPFVSEAGVLDLTMKQPENEDTPPLEMKLHAELCSGCFPIMLAKLRRAAEDSQ